MPYNSNMPYNIDLDEFPEIDPRGAYIEAFFENGAFDDDYEEPQEWGEVYEAVQEDLRKAGISFRANWTGNANILNIKIRSVQELKKAHAFLDKWDTYGEIIFYLFRPTGAERPDFSDNFSGAGSSSHSIEDYLVAWSGGRDRRAAFDYIRTDAYGNEFVTLDDAQFELELLDKPVNGVTEELSNLMDVLLSECSNHVEMTRSNIIIRAINLEDALHIYHCLKRMKRQFPVIVDYTLRPSTKDAPIASNRIGAFFLRWDP